MYGVEQREQKRETSSVRRSYDEKRANTYGGYKGGILDGLLTGCPNGADDADALAATRKEARAAEIFMIGEAEGSLQRCEGYRRR